MINRLGFIGSTHRNGRLLLWLTLLSCAPCHAGSPMFDAGQEAYSKGDIASALTLWMPLAKHGDADAQFSLGTIYYGGIGVPVDLTEASYWFLLAAEQGFAPAQYNLGNAYKRGEGVRENPKRAVLWWNKAAEQGLAAAQFNLATAYLDGSGVSRDIEKARSLYQQSADNGHYPAKQALEQFRTREGLIKSSSRRKPGSSTLPTDSAPCIEWLGQQNPDSFTLQLMSSTERSDTQKIQKRHALDPHAICAYNKNGGKRYMLLYGAFPDRAAAQQAISTLPAELRKNQPWMRQIRTVIKQISAT